MPNAVRLRKVGGSVMLAIPRAMLDALELAPDASVGLSVKAGKLVVDPQKRRRYSLDELLGNAIRRRDARARIAFGRKADGSDTRSSDGAWQRLFRLARSIRWSRAAAGWPKGWHAR